jgi:hypothetical protein
MIPASERAKTVHALDRSATVTGTTNYNSSQSMTAQDSLHSLLDYQCLLFCVTDLVLIYESVTSSASVVRWLTFHSWTLNFCILLRLNDSIHEWTVMNWTVASEPKPYDTTDGQSVSLSWNKAPIWGLRQDFYYCQTFAGLVMWGAHLTRGRVCRLQLLLVFASAVIFGSESHGTSLPSPPTTRKATVEVFDPASTRVAELTAPTVLVITSRHGPYRKHPV